MVNACALSRVPALTTILHVGIFLSIDAANEIDVNECVLYGDPSTAKLIFRGI